VTNIINLINFLNKDAHSSQTKFINQILKIIMIFLIEKLYQLQNINPTHSRLGMRHLTPKGQRPFFGLFLEFGQPMVDAIFVPKISIFW
jgi:hypothetical protein